MVDFNGGPVKTKTIGGVKYNANQFDAKDLGDGRFQLTSKKTKEIMIFPEQPRYRTIDGSSGLRTERNAEVKLDIDDGMIWDDANYEISQIEGLQFKSSKEAVSKVKLKDCNDSTVDLSANNSRHYADSAIVEGGGGNEVIMDKKDKAQFDRPGRAHHAYVGGEGIAAQDDYTAK